MPAVTSKKMSLELRAEARAGTSMVLVLQLSVPCTWKSLVADAGGPFPLCSVLPYKRAGPQAEARPPGALPPRPSGGQAASGPRGPMLEDHCFLDRLGVRIPSVSDRERSLSKWTPHPISEGSGHSSPKA